MRVMARPDCHRELPDGRTNPSITIGREYVVAGVESDLYRLVNDKGEPILFEAFLFEVVDPYVDPAWARSTDEDGAQYANPPECDAQGFHERWHDGDEAARTVFAAVHARLVADDNTRPRAVEDTPPSAS